MHIFQNHPSSENIIHFLFQNAQWCHFYHTYEYDPDKSLIEQAKRQFMPEELIGFDAQGHVLKLSQLQFGKRKYKA